MILLGHSDDGKCAVLDRVNFRELAELSPWLASGIDSLQNPHFPRVRMRSTIVTNRTCPESFEILGVLIITIKHIFIEKLKYYWMLDLVVSVIRCQYKKKLKTHKKIGGTTKLTVQLACVVPPGHKKNMNQCRACTNILFVFEYKTHFGI